MLIFYCGDDDGDNNDDNTRKHLLYYNEGVLVFTFSVLENVECAH